MRIFHVLGLATLALGLQACGNPTVKEAAEQFSPAYCQKLQSCFPEAFTSVYPMGVDACVAKAVASAEAKGGDKLSACTQTELDNCISDLGNLSCSATLDAQTLPSSCQKC